MMTETPEELFTFATRLTSNYDTETVTARVNSIINRLGLEQCRNTIVGGAYIKGLSGGERKRTSIGYEMVTNPRVLLLDEPTSGLDASTALSIGRTMRQEAKRGMAILCTIHSPSTDLFHQFDRVIVMSVGRTIYNGPVNQVNRYFSALGSPLPAYTNPADFLIRVAIDPKLVGLHLSVMKLEKQCKDSYVNIVRNMKDEENFNLNLT